MSASAPSGNAMSVNAMSVNVALVRGRLSSPPEVRVLESGRTLAVMQVTARPEGERAVSVPVTAWDPPAWVEDLDADDEVVVVGQVRRRFYRAASGSASKVEIEAAMLAKGGDRRRVSAVLRRARKALDGASR